MNTESTKTLSLVVAALLLAAAAWFTYPKPAPTSDAQAVGKSLFPNLSDPQQVKNLRVVQYDQKNSKSLALEVASINEKWVIPSHGNYPADAKDHLADAANSLIDLKVLAYAPGLDPGSPSIDDEKRRREYNRFGVIDPEPSESVKSTDDGVGTHVTMKDGNGQELAAAIIGKTLPDQTDQCYLRIPGKDLVYIVQLDPSKLSVHFTDWIERNLLNLNSIDLKQVRIDNDSYEPAINQRGELVLSCDRNGQFRLDLPADGQPWKLVQELQADHSRHAMVPVMMAADEEVNTATLDAMKSALEDLKIVDVERKPGQIPADLHVGQLDNDTMKALIVRGFIVGPDPQDTSASRQIYSKSGEIDLQLADGARYVLRFGLTTGQSSTAEAAKGKKAASKDSDPSTGMDRYMFVMADFNQDAIPKPVVEQLPPEEKPAPKAEENKADAKKTDVKKTDEKTPGSKDAKTPDPKAAAPGKETVKAEPAKTEPKKDEPKKPNALEEAEKAKQRAAEKARIDTENQRHKDEYEAKVVAGKKHVADLNKRFAQWYYVIPGDVYDKIHLDRKAIVKKKEPPKEDHDHDHDHEHEHEHEHSADLPVGPAGALKNVPAPDK